MYFKKSNTEINLADIITAFVIASSNPFSRYNEDKRLVK